MKKRKTKSLWLTKGHRYDLGSWMVNQSKNAVEKAFNTDGVFDLNKAAGSIGGSIGALGDIIGTSVQLGTISDTSDDRGLIQNFQNTTFSGNTTDSLLGEWNSTNLLDNHYASDDIRGYSDGEMAGKIVGSIGKGALAGSKFGPYGALIGGAIGGISSGIGALIGTKKAEDGAFQLKQLQREANNRVVDTFNSQAQQVDYRNALNRNIYANGGELNDVTRYNGSDYSSGNSSQKLLGTDHKKEYKGKSTPLSRINGKDRNLLGDTLWTIGENIPVIGQVLSAVDVYSDIRSLLDNEPNTSGDYVNLTLDLAGLIPGLGITAKGAKALGLYKAAKRIEDFNDKVQYTKPKNVKKIKKTLSKVKDWNNRAIGESTKAYLYNDIYNMRKALLKGREANKMNSGFLEGIDKALSPEANLYNNFNYFTKGFNSGNDILDFTNTEREIEDMNEYKDGGSIQINPPYILDNKPYYKNGGVLEGDFDVDDITEGEIKELNKLGYSVIIL